VPRLKRIKYLALANQAYVRWLVDKPEAIAIDTETNGVVWYDEAFCVTASWRGKYSGVQTHYFELDQAEPEERRQIEGYLREMLGTPKLVFHNAKFDLQKLILAGLMEREEITPDRIEDTEACYFLLDEHKKKGLKPLAQRLLGADIEETKKLRKVKKKLGIKKGDSYAKVPREILIPYASKDAEYTLLLWEILRPKVVEELDNLYNLEMELCLVLLDMEAKGYRLDIPYVDKTTKEYAGKILACELTISDLTGRKVWYPEKPGQKTPEGCINPNAWQQTLPVIQERGIMVKSTADEVLKPHVEDEFVAALLELRGLKKIYGTYLLNMMREQRDGIIHPNFRQHGAKTGRMSSGEAQDG
jgi:DNA polymerase-1